MSDGKKFALCLLGVIAFTAFLFLVVFPAADLLIYARVAAECPPIP